MKILVLVTEAFGGKGGIALYNRDLLTALCNHHDYQEIVAIPRLMPNPPGLLPKKITYITEGIGGKRRYITSVFKTIRQHEKFDLIICGHINLLPIACLLKIPFNVPLLLLIYGIDAWGKTGSRLTNYLTGKIDYLIAISELTRKRFLEWSHIDRAHTFLLANAIHLDEYGTGSKSPELLDRYGLHEKTVLMTLGRMSRSEQYKGFDEILNILPGLIKQVPNLVYVAIGDGDDKQRLAAKAEELGVARYFIMPGYITEEEKADHYRLADVYVMPSYGEGFGFVLLEAMACGIPVIASESDGTREAVRNGKLGKVVDPKNPDQLKEAIMKTLMEPKEIPEGLDYFSFKHFSQRLHRIISQITGATL